MEGDVARACAQKIIEISIHALRVEGDTRTSGRPAQAWAFLSTPSGWRATISRRSATLEEGISIHALRVEGDRKLYITALVWAISIHALRVEGDSKNGQSFRLFLRKREKNLPL